MNTLLATFYYLAQTYGCGTYGSGSESTGSCSSAAASGGSSLVNTGFVVIAVITAACVIIFVTLLIRMWRKKGKLNGAAASTAAEDYVEQKPADQD